MSYCDCDIYDYEPGAFSRIEDVRRARKRHTCTECGARIAVGEPYRRATFQCEGTVNTLCVCTLCIELEEWARISVPCFCNIYGELHERVREMVKDVAPNVPGFFFEYGRRMVKIRQHAANSKFTGPTKE